MKKWIGKSPLVLYVTERFLQNRYPSHGYVTHASNVMLDISEPDILEKRLLRIKNITSERLMLGTVGKIDFKTKGHHIAIQALKEFKKKGGDFTWKVVGPGENSYLQSLAKRAGLEDNIQIVGKLTAGKQMMEFYDSIDILIHPSLQEGLPRSIIEAMSRACPVLASSIAGTPELLPGKYLHKPGRYTELFIQLTQLAGNIECLQKMAQENLEKSKEFQKQKLQKRRFEFYKELKILSEKSII
jgi:glycosyltransferase involved in cell wall biosynthesis